MLHVMEIYDSPLEIRKGKNNNYYYNYHSHEYAVLSGFIICEFIVL